jgi:hypothetical protein
VLVPVQLLLLLLLLPPTDSTTHMAAQLAPKPQSLRVTWLPCALQKLWKVLVIRPGPVFAAAILRVVFELS